MIAPGLRHHSMGARDLSNPEGAREFFQRSGMRNHHVPCDQRTRKTDLSKRRFHFIRAGFVVIDPRHTG